MPVSALVASLTTRYISLHTPDLLLLLSPPPTCISPRGLLCMVSNTLAFKPAEIRPFTALATCLSLWQKAGTTAGLRSRLLLTLFSLTLEPRQKLPLSLSCGCHTAAIVLVTLSLEGEEPTGTCINLLSESEFVALASTNKEEEDDTCKG